MGGEIVAQKLTIQLTTVTTTLIETDDIIRTLNTTQSTSTNSGALQITGGAGIGGNLYVGGTIFGNVNATVSTATNANNLATVLRTTSADHFLTFVDSNNTASAYELVYTTSSFVINPATGNVGVGGNIEVNRAGSRVIRIVNTDSQAGVSAGILVFKKTLDYTSFTPFNEYAAISIIDQLDTTRGSIRFFRGASGTQSIVGIHANSNGTTASSTLLVAPDFVSVQLATSATSTATGALQVAGGVGIGGNLYVGGTIFGTVNASVNTATNANNLATVARTTNAAHFLTFVDSNNASSAYEAVYTTSTVKINPSGPGAMYIGSNDPGNFNSFASLQVGGPAIYANGFNNLNISTNLGGGVDAGGSTGTYAASGSNAARYQQVLGSHVWYNAPIGTAGNAITWNQIMTINTLSNVGIGTVAPTTRLEVSGGARISSITTITDTTQATSTATGALQVSGGVGIAGNLHVGGTIFGTVNASVNTATNANNIATVARSTSADHFLTFVDSNNAATAYELAYTTSSFVINPATGNVGIGATSPNYKLDVAGSISMHDEAQSLDSRYYGATYLRGWSEFAQGSESDITYATTSTSPVGTEVLTIAGTATWGRGPRIRLDRTQNYEVEMWIRKTAGASAGVYYMVVSNWDANGAVIGGDGTDWHYPTSAVAQTTLTTGTWVKHSFVVGPYGGTKNHNSTATYIGVGFIVNLSGGTDTLQLTGFKCRPISRYSNDALTIFNSGNIGIGTTATTTRLDVAGGARITGITTITDVTQATSTITGALQVAGGVGIRGNLHVGGTIIGSINAIVTTTNNVAGGAAGQILIQSGTGTTAFIPAGTSGHLLQAGTNTATFVSTSTLHVGTANFAASATNSTNSTNAANATTSTNVAGGAAGRIPIQSDVGTTAFIPTGSTGQVLTWSGSTATWAAAGASTTATNLAGGLIGQIPIQSAGGVTTFIPAGTSGQLLQAGTNTATFVSTTTLHVGTANTAANAASATNATNATNAANVATVLRTTSADHFLTFVDSNNAASANELVYTTSSFVINPATGNVGIGSAPPTTRLDVAGGTRITGITTVTNATQASSTTTGALQVSGGVGIGGNLHVGGEIVAQRLTIQFTTVTTTLVETDDIIRTLNTTQATSTNSGALQVSGGAGIGGNLYVGGSIFGTINATVNTATNANNIATVAQTASANYFPVFVDANNLTSAYELAYTTSTFAINPATGNVGIGTTPIAQSFGREINFNSYLTIGQHSSSTSVGYLGWNISSDNSPSNYRARATGDKGSVLEFGSDGSLRFANSGANNGTGGSSFTTITERFRITQAGDVGIGVVSPSAKLHVVGAQAIVQNTSPSYSLWKDATPSTAGRMVFNNAVADGLSLGTFNGTVWTDTLNITSAGNVAIGTTGPSAKLDVFAGQLSTASNSTLDISNVRAGTTNDTRLVTRLVRVSTGTDWTTSALRVQGMVDVTNMGYIDFIPTGATYGLAFGVAPSGVSTEAMRILSSGNLLVGRTTAFAQAYRAVVEGNSETIAVPMAINDARTGTADSRILAFLRGGTETGYITSTNGLMSVAGNNGLAFQTASSEQMRITNTGNVLIGTTTAGSAGLAVNPGLNISFAESADQSLGTIFRQANSADIVLGSGVRRSSTANGFASSSASAWARSAVNVGYGAIKFFTAPEATVAAGTDVTMNERMRIDSVGNVGISTTSPSARLQVGGSTATSQVRIYGGTAGTAAPELMLYGASSDHNWTIQGNHSTALQIFKGTFGSLGSEFMRISATGDVGIGTVSPGGKLEVYRTSSDPTIRMHTNFSGGNTVDLNPFIVGVSNGGYSVSIAGTIRQVIDTSGNFGIGTTSPASRLGVGGTTAITWAASGISSGLVTIGDQGASGSSLFVNTPTLNSSFASGLAVDGTYSNPGGVGTSVVNLKALGVNSGGGYDSALSFQTTLGTTLSEKMRITGAGNVGIGVSPSSRLHIRTTAAGTDGLMLDTAAGANPWVRVLPNATVGSYNNNVQANDAAFIYSAGTIGSGALAISPWNSATLGNGIRMDNTGTVRILGVNATSTTTGALQVLGGAGVGGNLWAGGNIVSANSALFTGATGSTIYSTAGTAIVSAVQQGGRVYEGSHDFDSYPNLYSSMFINISTGVNVPSGMTGNGYRFIMGAGDTTTRGFDLVGSSGSSGRLWIRARENGTSSWARVYTTNDTISVTNALTINNGGSGAASGSTFNGSSAVTISYNTVGAPSTTGANASGNWAINITGNASSVTNGVYTTGNQTIGGTKTFSSTILLADGGFMFNSDGAQDTGISWASDGVMNFRSNGTTVGQIVATGFSGNGASLTSLNASNLGSGTVPTARLASGTANSTTFLRGDQTWASVPGGTTVETTARTTNANHFLAFVDSNNASATAESVYTTSTFFVNPSSGAVSIGGNLTVSANNVSGQGIILSDDGDIVDLNDGYCAMRFASGVRVHSGNKTGSAVVALTNGGAVIASGDVTAFGAPSDIKLKENIENIPNALEKLLTLNGVNFNYKKDGARSTGVIAQEVEKVLPEVIYETTDAEGIETFKAVRYGNMVGLLIEAIKEQQKIIDDQKTAINNLDEKINQILSKLGK